jgi:hypothetical protein
VEFAVENVLLILEWFCFMEWSSLLDLDLD